MAWDTVANIVSDAALEMGLIKEAVSNPYASTNPHILQLNAHLKSLGQELLRDYSWSQLVEEHTFSTADGTANYDLPSYFARFVDGSGWNRTSQLPLVGPVSGQQWQALKGRSDAGAVSNAFRIWQDDMWIHPTPTAIETVAYEYVSKLWVAATGESAPTKEAPTVSTDELWIDRQVLVTGLKLKFKRARGFDTTAEQDDFDRALARAQGADGSSPTLNVGGPRADVRLVDGLNLPETGFGG